MTQDSRLIFAAKGVGAFFGFLLLFFGVSTYLGGGITGIGASVVLAVIAVVVLVLLWPRFKDRPETPSASTVQPSIPSATTVPQNNPGSSRSPTELCYPGPYYVVSGDTLKIKLDVKTGDKIEGYIHEINNDFFDWIIVDEDQMVRFFDGTRYRPIAGKKNVTVSKINCQVPRPGPYYLLLDIGSRLNDRQVEVVLRRS